MRGSWDSDDSALDFCPPNHSFSSLSAHPCELPDTVANESEFVRQKGIRKVQEVWDEIIKKRLTSENEGELLSHWLQKLLSSFHSSISFSPPSQRSSAQKALHLEEKTERERKLRLKLFYFLSFPDSPFVRSKWWEALVQMGGKESGDWDVHLFSHSHSMYQLNRESADSNNRKPFFCDTQGNCVLHLIWEKKKEEKKENEEKLCAKNGSRKRMEEGLREESLSMSSQDEEKSEGVV